MIDAPCWLLECLWAGSKPSLVSLYHFGAGWPSWGFCEARLIREQKRPVNYSDYVIYVDESGDHSLTSIDPQYPVFVLAFCIVKKTDYFQSIVPRFQEFKFKWFGHDMVVFHESDIRRRLRPFVFLGDPIKREQFMTELSAIVVGAPFQVIAVTIRKDRLRKRYISPENPYSLALLFCMERAGGFISHKNQLGITTHVVCEARGSKEDKALELEFLRIVSGRHYLQAGPLREFELVFAHKQTNSTARRPDRSPHRTSRYPTLRAEPCL